MREKKERAPWECDICVRMTERKREGKKRRYRFKMNL